MSWTAMKRGKKTRALTKAHWTFRRLFFWWCLVSLSLHLHPSAWIVFFFLRNNKTTTTATEYFISLCVIRSLSLSCLIFYFFFSSRVFDQEIPLRIFHRIAELKKKFLWFWNFSHGKILDIFLIRSFIKLWLAI